MCRANLCGLNFQKLNSMSSVVIINVGPHYNIMRRATCAWASQQKDRDLQGPFRAGLMHQTQMSF